MARTYNRIIELIFAAVLVTACSQAPTSPPPLPTSVTQALASSPTAAPPTPIAPPVTPTSVPPTTAKTAAPAAEINPERSDSMQIKITGDDTEITGTLVDNKATQDFIALLPLTLTLEDYGNTEKIYYLPERLSTQDAPEGMDPAVGDITYYAPWGNLAIFIRDFGYSSGLVLLGRIDGDVNALGVPGPINVTIELVE